MKMNSLLKCIAVLSVFIFSLTNSSMSAQTKGGLVAFYNLENLFDTIDDPNTNDRDFLPNGKYTWGTEKYNNKLKNMSEIISKLGDDEEHGIIWGGPTFLGVSEIENRRVLEDLVNTPTLKPSNYDIVHFDSPDKRGIDVAFLYRKDYFRVISAKAYELVDSADLGRKTRDQLLVSGIFDEDTLHFIVNHWPSRFAGDEKRVQAAKLCRSIVDELLEKNPEAKIFVMGDFNDTPINKSINYLVHKSVKRKNKDKSVIKLHNDGLSWHKKGFGTLCHKDVWQTFDMIIVSPSVMNDKQGFRYKHSGIHDKPFMHQKNGRFAGYPLRTHAGGNYLNGYSDHFPVYMYIVK